MPFSSVYDTDAIRLLSTTLGGAMRTVRSAAPHPLTEAETAAISKRLADKLMSEFDLGERDPSALKRVALAGISEAAANP